MKGVILAGGRGTRLRPMTRVVNKHVLPIYNQPLIYYPVQTLLDADINEIMVISNAEHIGKYIQLLEEDFDAKFSYRVQSDPKGIAHAVSLSEDFVDDEFVVILGDNVFLGDTDNIISPVSEVDKEGRIVLKEVDEPTAYGVASMKGGHVTKIEEKPDSPDSTYAVIGLYVYTKGVFRLIENLKPSSRGEYEITDLNNELASRRELDHVKYNGKWFDAGTPEGLFTASKYVRDRDSN